MQRRQQQLPRRKPLNVESAQNIGAMRARLGLTLQECAEYLGVPLVTLVKWENGTRTPGSAAKRLFEVLGMIEVIAPDLHEHFLPPVRDKRRRRHAALQPRFLHH